MNRQHLTWIKSSDVSVNSDIMYYPISKKKTKPRYFFRWDDIGKDGSIKEGGKERGDLWVSLMRDVNKCQPLNHTEEHSDETIGKDNPSISLPRSCRDSTP